MLNSKMIIDQVRCDMHNIQELINMLPYTESKGDYRSIGANIKILVKEIKQQKALLNHKIYYKQPKNYLPLFEIELPELELCDLEDINSFFGIID